MHAPSKPTLNGHEIGHGRLPIAYERVLNPSQLEAATFGQGPLLVIAGAGSGKTRTLIYRVARLVEQGTVPKRILLLSFTRKASEEMLRRAALLLDARCQEVSGGTFHSFANNVLRRFAAKIGYPHGFSIIDRADSEDLIHLIRKEISAAEDIRELPRKSTLASMFSRAVNKCRSLEDIIYEEYQHFGDQIDQIYQIWQLYGLRKKEHYFLDYDDLLVCCQQLLTSDPAVRERLISSYDYILVDEYQDTNKIQAEIVFLLAGEKGNIMVVGDDAQSIYAFRGADHKNIIDFPRRFPATHIIKLEENYRSLQPILDLSNQLIAGAAEKYSKCLYTRRGGGELPKLVSTIGENAQSIYVVREIGRLRSQGVPLDQIAVLFRASFHSFDLELELNRAAIPFVKVGGFKFTDSAHIKDVLAHIKILIAPQDRLSWYRCLLLVDKIGPQSAQRIFEAVRKREAGAVGLLSAPLKLKANPGLDRLKELIAAMDATPHLGRWGEMIFNYYLPILKALHDDHPRRQRDIEQLFYIMERYDRAEDFIADMVLEPPNTAMEDHLSVTEPAPDCLTLSTIHSAKGLEWNTVFIIWALEGRFPTHHALEQEEMLEEERRLMYVAATRAQRELHITCPTQIFDRASQTCLYEPSRFLEGISEEFLERSYFDPRNAFQKKAHFT
ncbi:MAG: ATP-dependent helicase [Desulfobacteraceae bacterium]|nr:ATP-dependent helicase [Desulfobacteraceae bacterium]